MTSIVHGSKNQTILLQNKLILLSNKTCLFSFVRENNEFSSDMSTGYTYCQLYLETKCRDETNQRKDFHRNRILEKNRVAVITTEP